MSWIARLADFFVDRAPLAPADRLLVAFSGGPDSAALLYGLTRIPALAGRLVAAHLDHALDPGSAARAQAAGRLAAELGVPFRLERRAVESPAAEGGLEAAARRVRYAFLEEVRGASGARYIATAHHLDDQAETVLLRLRFGSGLLGMAGIRAVHGAVVRPLLDVPRAELAAAVAAAGLRAVDDPTNRDLSLARNRIRHRLLPALSVDEPELPARLARLAARAAAAAPALERTLERRLNLAADARGGAVCDRRSFAALPASLQPLALSLLARRAGAAPAARRSVAEALLGGLAQDGRLRLDAGGGWRFEGDDQTLRLVRRAEKTADFSYTVEVPGRAFLAELSLEIRLTRRPVEPWMFRGEAWRAALALPLAEGDAVVVRNRRPGDRVRPLGAAGSRRLKEVLIDRHLPYEERARIPLLCWGGDIAWIPGVTIDHRFRITNEREVWVAELSNRP